MSTETFCLRLRYRATEAGHEPTAWLIPGSNANPWLQELQQWQSDLTKALLLAIPAAADSQTPQGVLVLGIAPKRKPSPTAVAYRRLGNKLYLPCHATLEPAIGDLEVDDLTPFPFAVWHPSLGLIGVDQEDLLTVTQLITPPKERATNLSWAHPGLPYEHQLHAISPVGETSMHVLLASGKSDIGSEETKDLPPAPGESELAANDWRTKAKLRFLETLQRMADKAEPTAKPSPWINRLGEWTDKRINALRNQQETELQRLLHLIKTDPDQGLKYALPLFSLDSRGKTKQNSRLTDRDPNFNLGNLGGGQAASPWVLDWQKHQQLSKQYRDAASRELRLGRYRRAAYIYSELLKDHREAANVLRQGRCYREAAALYMKHLGDKLEAAHCLRDGGFIVEAIPIYEQKKQFETVGELYLQLGNGQESRRAYKLAVSHCLLRGQTVRAATLLEEALQDPQQAIAIVQNAWPNANDAALCLMHELSIYERLDQAEQAEARLDAVSQDHPAGRAIDLMDLLAKTSQQAPERSTRDTAERCGFIVAGRWLASPNFKGSQALLRALRQLAPTDKLLLRDTARFQRQLDDEARLPEDGATPHVQNSEPVTLTDFYSLPTWAQWFTVEPRGRTGFYALGASPQGSSMLRCDWQGMYQTQLLPNTLPAGYQSRVQLAVAHETVPEVVSVMGWEDMPITSLPPCDAFPNETRVENPPWSQNERFLGMAYADSGVAWVLQRKKNDSKLILSSYSSMGDLIATHTLHPPVERMLGQDRSPIPMICAQEQILWVYEQHLMRFYRDRLEALSLDFQPQSLCFSQRGQLRIVATGESATEVFWGDDLWGRRRTLHLELEHPKATFTMTGDMLVLSPGRLDLLVNDRGHYQPRQNIPLHGQQQPRGIFTTETPNLYALVTQDRVQTLRFDPRQR